MKIIKVLSLMLCAALLALATVGCEKESDSYWQTYTREYEDGLKMECFVGFDFTPDEKYEVWVNVSDFEQDATILFAAKYSLTGSGNYSTASVKLDADLLKATGGWIRLQSGVSKSYDFIDVSTKYSMRIHEVVVCDEKGNVYELTFNCAGERISRDSESNRRFYKDEEYAEMQNPPQNACDGKEAFDRATVFAAYKKAAGLSDESSS